MPEDIKNMKKMGFDGYRFLISWSRILPGGRVCAGINREGVDYYNDLIDTILANGMTPFVTLFHWDTPFCLEKEYDGFLSKKIVDDFLAYAEFCFWEFGDRVKYWATLNEPWSYALPDRPVPLNRTYSDVKYDKSDPAKDAYTVARNLLLAHSAASHSYRTKFKIQEGQIGIVLISTWGVPYDKDSVDDKAAALRSVDFMLGCKEAKSKFGYLETKTRYVKFGSENTQYIPMTLGAFLDERGIRHPNVNIHRDAVQEEFRISFSLEVPLVS
ncbi:strictosidine-o-beta-d-glucosidase [Phtheirospermum japonicum]|uniref:Strictosidine-o-beta-d-glucosidase n=1 Tax=Phtheirospermum japonicum TaxID=374723 RepID=A0A830CK05_9LAMI|nr:strictosidine-o-beta-d-glucosidase [Phtheirospermum japonicum]